MGAHGGEHTWHAEDAIVEAVEVGDDVERVDAADGEGEVGRRAAARALVAARGVDGEIVAGRWAVDLADRRLSEGIIEMRVPAR